MYMKELRRSNELSGHQGRLGGDSYVISELTVQEGCSRKTGDSWSNTGQPAYDPGVGSARIRRPRLCPASRTGEGLQH